MNRVKLESGASHVPALQAFAFLLEHYLGFRSMTRFTPGCHMTGFQPSEFSQRSFWSTPNPSGIGRPHRRVPAAASRPGRCKKNSVLTSRRQELFL